MEARIGGEAHQFYGTGMTNILLKDKDLKMKNVGKKSLDWNLNDWKWDGDLFIATPLNSMQARDRFCVGAETSAAGDISNSSSSCSDEINLRSEKGKRELEKRQREVVIVDDELNCEPDNLTLQLNGHGYLTVEDPNWDGKNGKKTKLLGSAMNRAVCQVEDCGSDLSSAKDYHRRHKVCEVHSKASKALVCNVLQRFCQQCSRFHLLQEFDEGKRSCRRRLAGHNKRRRKTQPDAVANENSLKDDQTSTYLLISLLRIISNMQSNKSNESKDQDILSHLLRNLAGLADSSDGRNIAGLLEKSQGLVNVGKSAGTTSKPLPALLTNGFEPLRILESNSTIYDGTNSQDPQMRSMHQNLSVAASVTHHKGNVIDCESAGGSGALKTISPKPISTLHNIDLNNVYDESQDCLEGFERSHVPIDLETGPPWLRQYAHQSSPPQTSGNSDSGSAQSPSTSAGDAQGRTDRIVFKLFGKDPNDFPLVLRAQILDWLSHSPTDIESYIRPGCIILTIYIRLADSKWQELCCNLSSSLSRFLYISKDPFLRMGWVYTRVQHQIAFIYNGQIVLDMPLPSRKGDCKILSISPLAVSVSEKTQFVVKGFNLAQPTTRLLCALEGKYVAQEATHDLEGSTDAVKEDDEVQCLSFTCSIPNVTGRGFIEVEDHGLSSSFFPFIVAEQGICSEICTLESRIKILEFGDHVQGTTGKMVAKSQALNFIHEMGWLLHRSHLRSRMRRVDPNSDSFPFTRFRGLLEFSTDHDWCAVVKKLLDILFDGTVGAGDHPSVELALLEMGLLHRAVQKSSRQVVELLLSYVPDKASAEARLDDKLPASGGCDSFFFRPDAVGPAGLTPLHIAASRDSSGSLLDALTDDPGSVGIVAWKNARDNTGFTPEDYARIGGHFSYIHLVQKKIMKQSEVRHVILDVSDIPSDYNPNRQQTNNQLDSVKITGFEISKTQSRTTPLPCKICDRQVTVGNTKRMLGYRPAVLSMVGIAAVCVCLGLFFKSSPEVFSEFGPFRWEFLDFGSM